MSDTDKKYVPEGVYLVCDKGQMASQLLANPERNVTIYGAKKCTEADNKFEQNILPFGSCKTCGTCKFAKIEWTKTKQGVKAKGSYALLEHSEGICKEGQGVIKIYFDEYLADLANENNNESAFVKESISSEILGDSLTFPFGRLIDLFCDDDNKFTEGVGRGFKKGMEGTWNFLTSDMWKADTWKGMGKLAVIGVTYSSPVTGGLMGDTSLQALDNTFGTDFKQTKDNLVEGVKKTAGNAWEDVKRGNMGEVGESYGQLQYAIVEALAGTKGAGLALKGATTGAKALIGAERLAQVAVTASNWMSKLKAGALGLVKVGSKPIIIMSNSIDGAVLPAKIIREIIKGEKIIDIVDEIKWYTRMDGVEHAVIKMSDGKRYIVSGGGKGISFSQDTKIIYGHTHPNYNGTTPFNNGASLADRQALEKLNQSKQYIFHDGNRTTLYKSGDEITITNY